MNETNRDLANEIQAKSREEFVLALFRLFKLATMHQLNNQAVQRGVEASAHNFGELLAREQGEISTLFAGENVFISGQPLKASRGTYESAAELGGMLADIGLNEVRLRRGVDEKDLMRLLEFFVGARSNPNARDARVRISDAVQMQYVDPKFLLGDGETEDVSSDQQVMRTFSSAVVVLRRMLESVEGGQYRLMRTLKRIAQSLVMLAEQDPDTLRAVTTMRGTKEDHANLAVCAAVTATLSTFMLTRDIQALSRVCLAALTAGVGERRIAHRKVDEDDPFAASGSLSLTADEFGRVPSSDAVALVALAGLFPAASRRLPLAFEASWLILDQRLGPAYEGRIAPDVEALIIATSHKLHRELAFDIASGTQSTPDDVARDLMERSGSKAEQYVIQLVLASMEIFPRGTVIEMTSGWQGVVIGTPYTASSYGKPTVRLIIDPEGTPASPLDVDLSLLHADVIRLGDIERVLHDLSSSPAELVECKRAVEAGEVPMPSYPKPGEPQLKTSAEVDDMLSRVSDVLGSPSPLADMEDDLSFDEALSLTGSLRAGQNFAAIADANAAARSGNTASVSFDELLSLHEAPEVDPPAIEFPDLSSFPGKFQNDSSGSSALSQPPAAAISTSPFGRRTMGGSNPSLFDDSEGELVTDHSEASSPNDEPSLEFPSLDSIAKPSPVAPASTPKVEAPKAEAPKLEKEDKDKPKPRGMGVTGGFGVIRRKKRKKRPEPNPGDVSSAPLGSRAPASGDISSAPFLHRAPSQTHVEAPEPEPDPESTPVADIPEQPIQSAPDVSPPTREEAYVDSTPEPAPLADPGFELLPSSSAEDSIHDHQVDASKSHPLDLLRLNAPSSDKTSVLGSNSWAQDDEEDAQDGSDPEAEHKTAFAIVEESDSSEVYLRPPPSPPKGFGTNFPIGPKDDD